MGPDGMVTNTRTCLACGGRLFKNSSDCQVYHCINCGRSATVNDETPPALYIPPNRAARRGHPQRIRFYGPSHKGRLL
jgi:hypothetical protein